jgi:hypothetical protein
MFVHILTIPHPPAAPVAVYALVPLPFLIARRASVTTFSVSTDG